MWFWNRREIYIGFSMKDFSELRDKLVAAGIRYDYKINYPSGNTRTRYGSFGQNTNDTLQYYLYVHRRDYENAEYTIHL